MSNRINIIRGTSATYLYDVVDQDGERIAPPERLVDATATFEARVAPTDLPIDDILSFTTADAMHMAFVGLQVRLSLLAVDTVTKDLATYFYQIVVTLSDGTVLTIVPWAPLEIWLGGAAQPLPPSFDATTKVDQDYDQPDALRYMTPGGTPIDSAQIRIYYKKDYDAGNLAAPVGVSLTNSFGRWTNPVLLTPGFDYVVQFFKPNEFGPDVAQITV